MPESTATIYEWAGGAEAFERLTEVFYQKVMQDELLEPMFRGMLPDHPKHVATLLGEVFGGPQRYTDEHGGFPRMLGKHRRRDIQPEQRKRWVELILEAADEVEFPDDPAFRSAFVAYIEWGSRRAMANSKPDAKPSRRETIKRWGWGEAPPEGE